MYARASQHTRMHGMAYNDHFGYTANVLIW